MFKSERERVHLKIKLKTIKRKRIKKNLLAFRQKFFDWSRSHGHQFDGCARKVN